MAIPLAACLGVAWELVSGRLSHAAPGGPRPLDVVPWVLGGVLAALLEARAPVTYLGYDVLALNYNRLGPFQEQLRRKFVLLDSRTGKRVADEQAPAPAPSRPFTWTALGRAEIAAMRAFLDARVGRAVPFWLPSFQWDLSLAEDVLQDQSIVTIHWVRLPPADVGHDRGPAPRRPLDRWATAPWTSTGSPTPPTPATT